MTDLLQIIASYYGYSNGICSNATLDFIGIKTTNNISVNQIRDVTTLLQPLRTKMTTSRKTSPDATEPTGSDSNGSNNRHQQSSWVCSYKFAILIFIGRCLLDLVLCPHSKVEESFNLQASHDLMYFGISPALTQSLFLTNSGDDNNNSLLPYDHLQYPGGTLDGYNFLHKEKQVKCCTCFSGRYMLFCSDPLFSHLSSQPSRFSPHSKTQILKFEKINK